MPAHPAAAPVATLPAWSWRLVPALLVCLAAPAFFVLRVPWVGWVLLAAGLVSAPFALAFFCVAFLLGLCISIAAVGLEELSFRRYRRTRDLARLFLLAVLENFGYRQLLTWWRVRGMLTLRRRRWGAMPRSGFEAARAP